MILHVGLTRSLCGDYSPSDGGYKSVISNLSRSAFIYLIQENPISAAFSLLTMYSIRHHTLTDHPDAFHPLFMRLDYSEKLSHGIGKFTIPSPSPSQLIKPHRGPIPIEPARCNEVPRPFDLERTARRVR